MREPLQLALVLAGPVLALGGPFAYAWHYHRNNHPRVVRRVELYTHHEETN